MKIKIYFLLSIACIVAGNLYAQKGQNEFESKRLYCDLDNVNSAKLVATLPKSDGMIFSDLRSMMTANNPGLTSPNVSKYLIDFKAELLTAFDHLETDKNVAIIVFYRNFTSTAAGYKADMSTINVKIFHQMTVGSAKDSTGKIEKDTSFSSYLLSTKKIYVILIDQSDSYYKAAGANDVDQKLSSTVFKINYRSSYFKQSFSSLVKVWGEMGAAPSTGLGITLVKIEPSRVKAPCDLVASNKSFKNDETFTVHENNVASFQVGVSNSKLDYNNISITGGNLVVKPSSDQATQWKSNAYALLEMHLPRDIDNFRPVWQSLFSKPVGANTRTFGDWLYDNTISRIGIYGGVKIAKDPISNLYAGFNYAISKEFGFNFGWVWVNDYATQVTDIGSVSSVNDALQYAKRKYSSGKFSIGISFSPDAFSTAVGLKSKSADSGN